MGRRPDAPGEQEAKGQPGRRKSRAARQLAEAARVAELLAAAPAENGEALSPPKFMDERFAPALVVWRDLAPKLTRTHRLQALHRHTFAAFCVYYGEWVSALEDIAKNGLYQRVKTVSGDHMERLRPSLVVRDRAFQHAMELSKHFGLTPGEEYALFKDQSAAAANNPGLFDDAKKPPANGLLGEGEPGSPPPALVGALARLRSTPPGGLPN